MHILYAITVQYLTAIRAQRAQLHSTEELSYREALGNFLRAAKDALGKSAVFTGEPQKITFGRPDYAVTNGLKVIGYVEAESLGANLDKLPGHAHEQNERFRKNLHNFLQTNHFDFRVYVDEELVASASLPDPKEQGKVTVTDADLDQLQAVLEKFLDGATPAAATPDQVALQLARRARFLRVAADEMLAGKNTPLHLLWNLYRDNLFADITATKFADVYAQTFTYGLFLAWLNTDQVPFDRPTALAAIPDAVPPIQVLLEFGGGRRLPEEFKWIVDGICSDLDVAQKDAATRHDTGIADPLVSFYETFLKAYDPVLRDRAGVFYTPDAVVDFLVRAVDYLLRLYFGKDDGLADPTVRLLDPATGTATFLARSYRQARHTMMERGDGDLWPDRARNHVMPHFYGFERLPAAYTLAHVKLRQLLADTGVVLSDTDRLPVYLADTMMNKVPEQGTLPGADVLSEESREAAHVRDQEDVLVVLGNPPYFGKSDNPSKDSKGNLTFIGRLIESYKNVDGQRIRDRGGIKWLQNDYVKFIRFAQWIVERSGHGIVAFITDNSYLDNRTHRGMRQQLMQAFDEIFILDLHGNSNKKERSPDGSEDKNVFDIQEGVAVVILIRRDSQDRQAPVIHHASFYGSRTSKYDRLLEAEMDSIEWETLAPRSPLYLFMPEAGSHRTEYETGWKLSDIFSVNGDPSPGFLTTQNDFAISMSADEETDKVETLLGTHSEEEARKLFRLCSQDQWNYATAVNELGGSDWRSELTRVLWNPFDVRWTVWNSNVTVHRREKVMRHLLAGPNLALITTRATKDMWDCLACNIPAAHKSLTAYDISYVFPLYLYPNSEELFATEKRANISPLFLAALTAKVGSAPSPEEIFHYAYAVFHAPIYRKRYSDLLKTDFPRLPLPPDAETFQTLAVLGARLTALHLLEAPSVKKHGIIYKGGGSHVVKKMRDISRYVGPIEEGATGRVTINDAEYFENVPHSAWTFQVGGYRPAVKWLDDRKERALTEEDITHYRRLIASLRDTAALLPSIDEAFQGILDAAQETDVSES